MAVQMWTDVSILDGSIELAGNATNFALAATSEAKRVTALSTTGWESFIGGRKTAQVDIDLMTDMASGGVDDTMFGYLGVGSIPKSICTATADGSVAYLMKGINLSYHPLLGSEGDVAGAKVTGYASGSPLVRGQLIHPTATARTSSSTGASWELGAVSATQTLYAALHVLEVSGTLPTLTVKVCSDTATGFPSTADAITFTEATARTYEWKTLAGALTDSWFRVSYTIGGTNPSFKFAVTLGIAG